MSVKEDVRRLLEHGDLEMGHARAILGLPQEMQSSAASTVVGKGFSVRQAEALVRKLQEGQKEYKIEKAEPDKDINNLDDELSQKVGDCLNQNRYVVLGCLVNFDGCLKVVS